MTEKLNVLLVDDDKNIRSTLQVSLKNLNCHVETAESAEQALSFLRKKKFDLILTDFKMTGKSGIELIQELNKFVFKPLVVVMTAFASFENAVKAVQNGAFDYLPKPFSIAQLSSVLSKVKVVVDLKNENDRLKKDRARSDFFMGMVSPSMNRLQDFVSKISSTEVAVLITGESGTGKTELAKIIHHHSPRRDQPLIVVNGATLTESFLETEWFGYAKGAFQGATRDQSGKFEAAEGGTLVIEEVSALSASLQARLLRYLQDKVIERVGSKRSLELNVRIIVTTHLNLEERVASGAFREDLYYRLNSFECTLTALRYRKEDLPVLIQRFFYEDHARLNLKKVSFIPEEIMKRLLDYSWPGNVRELQNCLERMALLASDREMVLSDLPDSVKNGLQRKKILDAETVEPLKTLDDLMREHIIKVLEVEPNQEKAAERLGITTVTLWRKRKEYGLP